MDLLKVACYVSNPSPLPAHYPGHQYEYPYRHRWHRPAMSNNSRHSWNINDEFSTKRGHCGTLRGWNYMRRLRSLKGPCVATKPSHPARCHLRSATVIGDLGVIAAFGTPLALMGPTKQARLQQGMKSGADRNLLSTLHARSLILRVNQPSQEIEIHCPALPKTLLVAARNPWTCSKVFISQVSLAQE